MLPAPSSATTATIKSTCQQLLMVPLITLGPNSLNWIEPTMSQTVKIIFPTIIILRTATRCQAA